MRTIKRKCLVTLLLAAVALFNSLAASAQLTVKGTVIDDTDEPLIGVSVKEEGAASGVVTDFDGNYTIKVSSGKAVLVFSYIGMNEQKNRGRRRSVINVTMSANSTALDEVVVVGYGTQKNQTSPARLRQSARTPCARQS